MIKAQNLLANRTDNRYRLPTAAFLNVNQRLSKNDKNCSNYEKFMPGSGTRHEARVRR
jgi:hypothetical protein